MQTVGSKALRRADKMLRLRDRCAALAKRSMADEKQMRGSHPAGGCTHASFSRTTSSSARLSPTAASFRVTPGTSSWRQCTRLERISFLKLVQGSTAPRRGVGPRLHGAPPTVIAGARTTVDGLIRILHASATIALEGVGVPTAGGRTNGIGAGAQSTPSTVVPRRHHRLLRPMEHLLSHGSNRICTAAGRLTDGAGMAVVVVVAAVAGMDSAAAVTTGMGSSGLDHFPYTFLTMSCLRRRQQREQSTISVWPASPKAPSRAL
jgi:hypothetical protein